MLWVETPSNPMMKITDIAALADVAHAAGTVGYELMCALAQRVPVTLV